MEQEGRWKEHDMGQGMWEERALNKWTYALDLDSNRLLEPMLGCDKIKVIINNYNYIMSNCYCLQSMVLYDLLNILIPVGRLMLLREDPAVLTGQGLPGRSVK